MKKKSKKQYVGKLPINCRINIDYTGKKPKVKFGYPHKKEQKNIQDTGPHVLIFLILYLILSALIVMAGLHSLIAPTIIPSNCSINFTYSESYDHLVNGSAHYNVINETIIENQILKNWTMGSIAVYNKSISGFVVNCENISQNFSYSSFKLKQSNIPLIKEFIYMVETKNDIGFYNHPKSVNVLTLSFTAILIYALIIAWLFFFFFLNKYVARFLLKFKWYQKIIPEYNARLSGRSYYKIIKEVPANKIVEIPLFKNVKLDYNAEGEFSKYLERVEIREHPFSKGILKKGKIKKKTGNNYILWYAKFYFKEIPKGGQLEIFWR